MTTCHSNNHLFVQGYQYCATATVDEVVAAEQRQGRTPLIIVEVPGSSMVVVDAREVNPMLAKVIKGHLAGKWIMIVEPDKKLEGRQIGPELEQRLQDVLGVLPIGWGEQPDKAEELGITPRELAWALAELDDRGLVHRPKQGTWVKVPVAMEKE